MSSSIKKMISAIALGAGGAQAGKVQIIDGYGKFKPSLANWGEGTMTYDNGDVYTGKWNAKFAHMNGTHGCPHGKGKYTLENGNSFEGTWKDGVQQWENYYGGLYKTIASAPNAPKRAIFETNDGNQYTGEYIQQVDSDGNPEFVNKEPNLARHGKGVMMYRGSGDVYDGPWKNDKKHGWGKFTPKDGKTAHGYWVANKRLINL